MNKIIIVVLVILIVALAVVYTQMKPVESGKEQACMNSGGTVKTSLCCQSASDFPNNCLIGACGCAPTSSHEVKVCECPEGMCFDGSKCA